MESILIAILTFSFIFCHGSIHNHSQHIVLDFQNRLTLGDINEYGLVNIGDVVNLVNFISYIWLLNRKIYIN